jgi:hypothetical protein
MIARLLATLPFRFVVPEQATFKLYHFESNGCLVTFYPPVKSEVIVAQPSVDAIKINGAPAFEADTLKVEFRKEAFDRSTSAEMDPPSDFIRETINSFLSRTRLVTKAPQIRPIDFPKTEWRLDYFNDDGTELEKVEGMVRGRFSREMKFSASTIAPEVWDKIHELPVGYRPSRWHDLLLDAEASFPSVSLVVVLTSTALEVFISHVLNELAERGRAPLDIWRWINARDYPKVPSTEEQFDELLKIMTGHSLKEDMPLWESFKNLRKARNSFVHEGQAKLGNSLVALTEAARFLRAAKSITELVSSWLPDEMIEPDFKFNIQLQLIKNLFKSGGTSDPNS